MAKITAVGGGGCVAIAVVVAVAVIEVLRYGLLLFFRHILLQLMLVLLMMKQFLHLF